jgi:hypothetical protein
MAELLFSSARPSTKLGPKTFSTLSQPLEFTPKLVQAKAKQV